MKRLDLTEIARADRDSIRRYSTRTSGQEQTTKYMDALRDTLKGLVRGTVVIRARDDLRASALLRLARRGAQREDGSRGSSPLRSQLTAIHFTMPVDALCRPAHDRAVRCRRRSARYRSAHGQPLTVFRDGVPPQTESTLTAAVILTLSTGVGVSAAMFDLVDVLLFRYHHVRTVL